MHLRPRRPSLEWNTMTSSTSLPTTDQLAGAYDQHLDKVLVTAREQKVWTPSDGPLPSLFVSHGAPFTLDNPNGSQICSVGPSPCPSPAQSWSSLRTGKMHRQPSLGPRPAHRCSTTSTDFTRDTRRCRTPHQTRQPSAMVWSSRSPTQPRCTSSAIVVSTTGRSSR